MIDQRELVIESLIAAFPATVIPDLNATVTMYAEGLRDVCMCEIVDATFVLVREARVLPTVAEVRQVIAELRVNARVHPRHVEHVLHEIEHGEGEEEFDFDRVFDE